MSWNLPSDESTKSNYYPNALNWWELPQECDACHLPMHRASGKQESFCPNCAIDRINAQNARQALTMAKIRDIRKRAASGELNGAFASEMPL